MDKIRVGPILPVFVKFGENWKNSAETQLTRERNRKFLKTRISAKCAKLLAELSDKSAKFYHYEFVNSPDKKVYPWNA
jgi:hypothetical protein